MVPRPAPHAAAPHAAAPPPHAAVPLPHAAAPPPHTAAPPPLHTVAPPALRTAAPLGSLPPSLRARLAPKAARLDHAAASGLAVPWGVVVPAEACAWLARCGATDPRVRLAVLGLAPCPGPAQTATSHGGPLAAAVRAATPALHGTRTTRTTRTLPPILAVRSAFAAEDADGSAQAGRYRSLLGVSGADPAAVLAAIERVRASGPPQGRRDVLIMQLVAARHAGVAVSEPDHLDDVVRSTEGLAEPLTAGRTTGRRVLLPRAEPLDAIRVPAGAPPFAERLARLLRSVRLVAGRGPWDVEWADDGVTCWLVQLRPLTRPLQRDELLTVANHKEILPALPSTFMTSLIATSAPELFAFYRSADPTLPASRPFVEVVAGRPFLNRSLLRDLLRHLGLPTRLVTDAMGGAVGVAEPDVGVQPARLFRKVGPLARLGVRQLGVTRSARHTGTELRRVTAAPAGSFQAAVERARSCYVALVTEMFGLANAMSLPVAVLRRAGVLAELARDGRSAGTQIAVDLAEVGRLAAADPAARAALEAGRPPQRGPARVAWERLLARHGHRGVYESDLARPRYRDDPGPLARAAVHARPALPRGGALPWQARLLTPVWWAARAPIAARERLRSDAMHAFAAVRDELLDRAQEAADRGQLPAADALWLCTTEEVAALDDGWVLTASEAARRRAERADLAGFAFPETFPRSADPETFRVRPRRDGAARTLQGLGLTDGDVTGQAWCCADPAAPPPPSTTGPRVLVAPSVDAGWVTVFAHADAVVVETGGDLSHGSIILRELGIPAVTAVAGAATQIADGDRVRVRSRHGVVDVLGPPARM